MLAAGLLARNAVARGLQSKPWVKTSLAPGSKVVTEYLGQAGLTDDLEALGFHLVGYGCTTCIGNSGPLPDEVSAGGRRARPRRRLRAVGEPQLRGAHQPRREDELPGLAAAGRGLRAGRLDGRRPRQRPDRHGVRRRGRVPARHLAVRRGGRAHHRGGRALGDVPLQLQRGVRGRRALERARRADRRPLRLGRGLDVRAPAALLRGHGARARAPAGRGGRARAGQARRLGDHRPHLTGGLDQEGLAGRALPDGARRGAARVQLLRVTARQPRGDDARHVRQHPPAQPAGGGRVRFRRAA